MKKKVIEILRVSTSVQAAEDRAGLPAQRTANRRTAEQYGLEIVRSIEVIDVSGAAILARIVVCLKIDAIVLSPNYKLVGISISMRHISFRPCRQARNAGWPFC